MNFDIKDAKFSRAITQAHQAPRPSRPTVVFAGRSNVGKSSLINAVVQKKGLARTSSTPGRTQEIVYFDINAKCYFVDLPGYGFAKAPEKIRSKWGPMIERFLKSDEDIRLVILILDARRDPTQQDLQMIEWLRSIGRSFIIAVTKSDKLGTNQLKTQLQSIQKRLGLEGNDALVPFSSETGLGRKELIKVILEAINPPAENSPPEAPESI